MLRVPLTHQKHGDFHFERGKREFIVMPMSYKDSYKIVRKTCNIILAFSHTLLGSFRDEIALKRLQGQGGCRIRHVVALIRSIWNKKLAISEARYLFKGVRFTYQDNITERKKIKEN